MIRVLFVGDWTKTAIKSLVFKAATTLLGISSHRGKGSHIVQFPVTTSLVKSLVQFGWIKFPKMVQM